MSEDAKARLDDVRAEMAQACKVAGRAPSDVQLIAISKTKDAADIRPLIAAGQHFWRKPRAGSAGQMARLNGRNTGH